MNAPNPFLEEALIIHGLFTEETLWNELKELLKEIENLPQPVPWPRPVGSAGKLHLSVHRKTQSGEISPALEWAASALGPSRACAAIAVKYGVLEDDRGLDFSIVTECMVHDLVRTLGWTIFIRASPHLD